MTAVHILRTGRRIAPFGDPVDEALIHNRPLAWWRDKAVAEAGLSVVDVPTPPCLVIPDTLLTSGTVLRRFVDGAAGRNATLVLATSAFGAGTTALQPGVEPCEAGWRFTTVRFDAGDTAPPVDVVIDPEEDLLDLDIPLAFRDPDKPAQLALPRHPVMTIHHWAHLLWASQAAAAMEVRSLPRLAGLLRVLWAVIRARSFDKWRVLAKLNTIGARCDIHPTAVIEGSTLGDGVTVGPFARVLFSRLGDGVKVMAGAHVEASSLADGAAVAQLCGVRGVVLYPEAFSGHQMMQASVLGRRALTTLASYAIDLNLEQNIRVLHDGALHDSGTRFLGAAIGHRSRMGTGIWMASGRAIPNDVVLVRDASDVLARLPEHLEPGTWVVRDGTVTQP